MECWLLHDGEMECCTTLIPMDVVRQQELRAQVIIQLDAHNVHHFANSEKELISVMWILHCLSGQCDNDVTDIPMHPHKDALLAAPWAQTVQHFHPLLGEALAKRRHP